MSRQGPNNRAPAGVEKDHIVYPAPLREEPAELLSAFEDLLGHPVTPLACYRVKGGLAYWDRDNAEITLLAPPVGQEYLGSVVPEDVDGADELGRLLEQRFGGDP